MTREQLLRELLVERFGRPVPQYRPPAVDTPPAAVPVPELAARRRRKVLEQISDDNDTKDDKPESKWAAAVRRYEAAVARSRRETA